MKRELAGMSTDDLWSLHLEVVQLLQERIKVERQALEERLRTLKAFPLSDRAVSERRPYPPVLPKYRNPERPSETWSGRGKQPRWLRAQLRPGKELNDFLIDRSSIQKRAKL